MHNPIYKPAIPETYINRRTLIIGDVNSGKTRLTQAIMQSLVKTGHGPEITLLDLAPETTQGIGGKMILPGEDLLCLTCPIRPPRLTGKDEHQIQRLAEQNAKAIDILIDQTLAARRTILIINDASLYLQAGSPDRFISMIKTFPTVIINAYYGHSFKPAPFTHTERKNIESLTPICNHLIRL